MKNNFNTLCEKAIVMGASALPEIVETLAVIEPRIKSWAIYPPHVDWDKLDKGLFHAWQHFDQGGPDSIPVRHGVNTAIEAIWGHTPD